MMSPIVFFYRGLSLNLVSTLPGVEIKTYKVHTPSPLLTIYPQRKIGLDSDVLRNLLPSVQFKKREKHPCSSVTFSKVAG